MIVGKLIEELKNLDSNLVVMASISQKGEPLFFVNLFGTSRNFPTITLLDIKPLPSEKIIGSFIEELELWVNQKDELENKFPVHLMCSFDYEDLSYDLRYFPLTRLIKRSDGIVLIGDTKESLELREHFK